MRTRQEIRNIDNELDLFDLDDWCFESHYTEKVAYFENAFDDSLFKPSLKDVLNNIPIVLYTIIFIGLFIVLGGMFYINIVPDIQYEQLVNLDSILKQDTVVTYVDGVECDTDTVIEASKICTDYFTILNEESGYSYLNNLCIDSSHYYNTYNTYVERMQYSYDMNDCYARLIRYFGSYCTLNKIQKVIEKDNLYYVYMNMTIPSEKDIQGYIRLYSYNFTKHFTITDVNEANIVRYLYSMEGVSKIPCSEQIVCMVMKKNQEGSLRIYDDSTITYICDDAYTRALDEVATLLGSSRIGK